MAILKVDTISGIGTEGSVFEGDIEFTSQQFLTLPKGNTEERGRGTRGVFGGSTTLDFVNIQNTANATDFGDTLASYGASAACSSRTRGIIFAGCAEYLPSLISPKSTVSPSVAMVMNSIELTIVVSGAL